MITDINPTVGELLRAHSIHPTETINTARRLFCIVRLFRIRGELDEATVLRLTRDAHGQDVTVLSVHRDLFSLVELGVIKIDLDDGSFSAVPESDLWPFGGVV